MLPYIGMALKRFRIAVKRVVHNGYHNARAVVISHAHKMIPYLVIRYGYHLFPQIYYKIYCELILQIFNVSVALSRLFTCTNCKHLNTQQQQQKPVDLNWLFKYSKFTPDQFVYFLVVKQTSPTTVTHPYAAVSASCKVLVSTITCWSSTPPRQY